MESTNFEFVRSKNESLANLGGLAEAVLHLDPGSALTRLRSFAEEVTKSIYEKERLPRLPQASFFDLLVDKVFEHCVNRSLAHQLHFLRKQGNEPAHGGTGKLNDAKSALKVAHQLAVYMSVKYYGLDKSDIADFKEVADSSGELQDLKQTVTQYKEALNVKAEEVDHLIESLDAERARTAATLEEPSEATQQNKFEASQQAADSLQWDEAKTRALIIDSLLQQAGWDVEDPSQVSLEFEVVDESNPSGKGFVDYVLWGADGQPLAVVEAKRSSQVNLQAGREQARLYADCLVKMGFERPVVFYSNGYETFIWDDVQYNTYRPVYGFYSKDSLEYLVYQRQFREPDLEKLNPDVDIAGRPYQIEAIKTVASRFQQQRRRGLLVQATGTGKTRVAIAIAELLLRTGWGKRVLFLCDRKELRTQADDAFKEHLPSEPRCVVGEKNKIDQAARIYISTYPGMMNRFAQLDIGFFDLIVADESHRSIYNKYRDLFDYFDALQLGLTATPVKHISRNTFGMFDCEDTDPTFEFGLDAAINNEPPYLVPFRVKDLTTEFLREGIHYNDLDEDQKRRLEEDLGEEEAKHTTIQGKDIGRKIFSESTDRIIIENLMTNGIKDETGSLVGKTIIYAQRQDHAEHLEKLFCKMYPQYGTKVCKVIHNKIPKVETLIREFKNPLSDFRIAISVDMLDTGIDVPQVVNLVFAKPVRSWVKFWQMIGRGTRLSENLFGPGQDKQEFLIFDHYCNFTYFDEEYQEAEEAQGKSLLQTNFEARLELAKSALQKNHRDSFDVAVDLIRADINDLPVDSIPVKRELRTVHELQQTDLLQRLTPKTQHVLGTIIAPIMSSRPLRDKHAIQLDRLIANLETAWLEETSSFDDLRDQLLNDLSRLAVNIQAVRQKDAVISEVQTALFWENISIDRLEWARVELRGIMKYRQSTTVPGDGTPSTSTADTGVVDEERPVYIAGANEALQYRRRLKTILDEMITSNPILQKIYRGEPFQPKELKTLTSTILTSHPGVNLEVLNEFYGRDADQLDQTIRELIGMDSHAVEAHFTSFLHSHPKLTAQQVRFMNLLKNYIAENGTITVDKLYEPPFNAVSHEGIDGVFTSEHVTDLFRVLKPFLARDAERDDTIEELL